jgi:hypothetical protein
MARSMEDFIAELRKSLAGWRQDAARFDKQGATAIATQVHKWIAEAEEVISAYDGREDGSWPAPPVSPPDKDQPGPKRHRRH